MPGRPWELDLNQDPGALAGVILGDGGHLAVPPGSSAARLAQDLPPGPLDIEGGLGDLTFTPRQGGPSRRWRFSQGAWTSAPLPSGRNEVAVAAQGAYDVGALLARVRTAQLHNRSALRTLEASLQVDIHVQGSSGAGHDLGYRYDVYQAAGEGEELVRTAALVNGVRANLDARAQIPTVEARVSLALPVALAPTERFRYADGGAAGEGMRRLTFRPVDGDPALPEGELWIQEATGQILRQVSHRSFLPGTVRSEDLTVDYAEVLPGVYAMARSTGFERWITSGNAIVQVRRTLRFQDLRPNQEGFGQRREAARGSDSFMLKETVEGIRYFVKKDDGARALETRPQSRTRALAYGAYLLPQTSPPVLPVVALVGSDNNLGDRGIHATYLIAGILNLVQATAPFPGGLDVSFNHMSLLVPDSEQPVSQGRVEKHDAVGHRFGTANLTLGRDLGAGFRLALEGRFQYDGYTLDKNWVPYLTPGYRPPPNGLTEEGRVRGSWQAGGFQLQTFYGKGSRPSGSFGLPDALQTIEDHGRFTRWGGSAGYDLGLDRGAQFHLEAGALGGTGFDRFKSLDLAAAGDGTVTGFSPYAMNSDHATYAKVAYVLPPHPGLRLTLGLDGARVRALDDHKAYDFLGLRVGGDLPGFWKFTYERVDLGFGVYSTMKGARTVTGSIVCAKIF
jgi:hypothetical protein